jgi:hypothetical protein
MQPAIALGRQWSAPEGVVEAANALLWEIAPPSPVTNWLVAYWEPGEPWCPVERVIIAEAEPYASLVGARRLAQQMGCYEPGDVTLDELEGPDPRSAPGTHYCDPFGGWCFCKRDRSWAPQVVYGNAMPPSISQRQWEHFRGLHVPETRGCHLHPFWLAQGTGVGHVRRLNETAKAIARMTYGPTFDVPAAGDAPYAVLDRRALGVLKEMDAMEKWRLSRDWKSRTAADQREYVASEQRAFRARLVRWMDLQFEAAVSEERIDMGEIAANGARSGFNPEERAVTHALLNDVSAAPITGRDESLDTRALLVGR